MTTLTAAAQLRFPHDRTPADAGIGFRIAAASGALLLVLMGLVGAGRGWVRQAVQPTVPRSGS